MIVLVVTSIDSILRRSVAAVRFVLSSVGMFVAVGMGMFVAVRMGMFMAMVADVALRMFMAMVADVALRMFMTMLAIFAFLVCMLAAGFFGHGRLLSLACLSPDRDRSKRDHDQ